MTKGVILSILILAKIALSIDNNDSNKESTYAKVTSNHYKYYFGATAGFSTGLGLSLRKWFNEDYAIQITFGPYYHERPRNEGETSWLIGALTGYKSIAKGKYVRLLGYMSSHYQYYDNWYNYDYDLECRDSTIHREGKEKSHFMSIGAGAGIEIYVWRIGLNLMVGLAPNANKEYNDDWRYGIMVSPEAGLYIRF